jgi:transposase
MANQVISMQQIRALIQLLEKGCSLRSISAQLGISRQPVTLYAARLKNADHTLQELRQLSDNDLANIVYSPAPEVVYPDNTRRLDFIARVPYFLTELKRTGVTRLLLWEEYRKEYNNPYRYTQFCIRLKEASKVTQATMHLVHTPAAMVMVDFAGDKMSYVDFSTGELVLCPVLVCVLPFSKYTFAMPLVDATIPQVIKGLNSSVQYFEGVPLSLKTDNMKQVVTKSCRYEPVFTEVLQQWALHYNITLLATRVGKPKDKSAVENEVKIAYQRIYAPLRDEVFFSYSELTAAVQKQLTLHNEKLFQLKDHSRLQQFIQQERSLLQPLPPDLFVVKHQVIAKVQKNYHITLGENYHHYSVPYQFIGKQVSVVYDTDIVEVYFLHQRIALHRRSYKKHDFTTVGDHMPAGHQHFFEQQGWTPAYFLEQASRIGTSNACRGILRLHNQYGASRLQAACARALNGSVFNYRTIQNILVSNQDKISHSDQSDLFRPPEHFNLRGPDAYQ